MEIELNIDDIVDEVKSQIEESAILADIADRVREDLNISDIAAEVIGSYQFENAVDEAVRCALNGLDIADTDDAVKDLTERVATLEAALAAAGTALVEPARRVLHGVEVPVTASGLF